MQLMKLRYILLCILLVGGFSTSCINEDHSDCHNIYRLALSYMGDGNAEIFQDKIDRVQMYVFDGQNNCVTSKLLSDSEVKARLTELPSLDPGVYKIVCVGNAYETEVENLSSGNMNQILFSAKDYIAGDEVSGNDPLYWSSIDYQIKPFDAKQEIVTETTYFSSSHYDISVTVKGVPELDDESSYPVIKLVSVSPQTDFRNVAKGEPVDYKMNAVHDGMTTLSAVNNIMRHSDQAKVSLQVVASNGTVLAETTFADHLAANPKIDVTKNECLIPFEIVFNLSDVTISVPSWFVEDVALEF